MRPIVTMEKTYHPKALEQHWYQIWEAEGYFKPKNKQNARPYCIMIPPPNVTGNLHMGHAFQDTLMDVLIRYHRMQGDHTLWQVGTDHAGIATQMVVERQLAAEHTTRQALGREAFVERVWQWKAQSGGRITEQLRRMGASVDWAREKFTMDESLSKAVTQVFVQLYDEGLIYRGKRLVNWDPKLHTAISDLEVLSEEEQGHLWHFRYPLSGDDPKEYLLVATTRPETMLGDTAVAVHPQDMRYQHLIGKTLKLPLTDREIPIIADEYVDPEFGTGCVKITPAHDFNDFAVGQRHNLEMINVFDINASLNEHVPAAYRGMDRFKARDKIVEDLKALGLLEKIEPHTLKVPRGDRSGVVIEPYLTEQWFVKAGPLAKPAIEAVESGEIEFVPKNWENTYFSWMRDIQDWCISRQLWWGHRIPAWYDEAGQVYVGESEQAVRQKYQLSAQVVLYQDEDVLDTWFSSALWTFSTLGWPKQTPELAAFHPTSVLVTGFDIIFFWVARMIMMSLKLLKQAPFKTVYVHGLVRDAEGQKMSKSKGNVLDPLDIIDGITLEELITKRTQGMMQPHLASAIEKQTREHFPEGIAEYGTDALRFTFLSLASTGRDIKFDISRLQGYRNFCNKIWNAIRFVLMNVENADCTVAPKDQDYNGIDLWIETQFQKTVLSVRESLDHYRFDHAAQALYEFIWSEYCDWYLELAKVVLYSHVLEQRKKYATQYKLLNLAERILRLAHPMMPYITESLWQLVSNKLQAKHVDSKVNTIMLTHYPEYQLDQMFEAEFEDTYWLKQVTVAVRTIRAEMNLPPSKKLPILLRAGTDQDRARVAKLSVYWQALAKLSEISWWDKEDPLPPAATVFVAELEVAIPMSGVIDKVQELQRLQKELVKVEQDYTRCKAKLENSHFKMKAPPAVVQKEQDKLVKLDRSRVQLLSQIEKIEAL